MEVETFPYRLDQRTRDVLSGLMGVLIQSKAKLQTSSSVPMSILFLEKDQGIPMDAHVFTVPEGLALRYPLNNVAKADPKAMEWLKQYHSSLSRVLKAPGTPAAELSVVMVEATYSGQLKYYLTYMVRYEDQSLAQDTPQGRLYATEPLLLARPQAPPAMPAQQAQPAALASEPVVEW